MLFTCPANAARGGGPRSGAAGRRPFCVDIHCHVHHPRRGRDGQAPALARTASPRPASRTTSPGPPTASRWRTSGRASPRWSSGSATWTRWAWTSRPSRRRPSTSCTGSSPSSARKVQPLGERAPGRHRQGAPRPLRRARPRAAAGARPRGRGARSTASTQLGLPGRRDRHQRGRRGGLAGPRRSSGAKAQELDVVVFMHPNGFTQGERLADHYFTNVIGNPLDTTVAARPSRLRRGARAVPEAQDRGRARRRLHLALPGADGPRVGRAGRRAHGAQEDAAPVAGQGLLRHHRVRPDRSSSTW